MTSWPVFCRLSIDVSKEDVLQVFFESKDRYEKTIVSCERDANRIHLHVFSMTTEQNVGKNIRQNLRNFLIKNYPQLKGNADYSISNVSAEYKKLEAYVVKEGDFVYYGFSDDDIAEFVSRSFVKHPKTTLQTELNDLETKFFNFEIQMDEFIAQYYDIKLSHNKIINYQQTHNYFRYLYSKTNIEFKKMLITAHINHLQIEAGANVDTKKRMLSTNYYSELHSSSK